MKKLYSLLVLCTTLGFGQSSPLTKTQKYVLCVFLLVFFVFCNMLAEYLQSVEIPFYFEISLNKVR